jgi:glutaredoxin 2
MMLSLTKETQLDKARKTLREVVSYADQIVRDERLRADIRSAAAHGAKASERVKKDVDGGGISSRLAADNKLRRNLRAMLDDLDHASDRVRRKKSHRARNVLLMLVVAVAALAAVPKIRLWLSDRTSEGTGSEEAVSLS